MKQIRGLQKLCVKNNYIDNEELNEENMAKLRFLRRRAGRCSGSLKGRKYSIGK